MGKEIEHLHSETEPVFPALWYSSFSLLSLFVVWHAESIRSTWMELLSVPTHDKCRSVEVSIKTQLTDSPVSVWWRCVCFLRCSSRPRVGALSSRQKFPLSPMFCSHQYGVVLGLQSMFVVFVSRHSRWTFSFVRWKQIMEKV